MINRDIQPLYVKHRDIKDNSSKSMAISLCRAINSLIANELIGVQQYFGKWRLYTKSLTARSTLLNCFQYRSKRIEVFDNNPFQDCYENNEKIIFKDLPFSVRDDKLLNYLSKYQNTNLMLCMV